MLWGLGHKHLWGGQLFRQLHKDCVHLRETVEKILDIEIKNIHLDIRELEFRPILLMSILDKMP